VSESNEGRVETAGINRLPIALLQLLRSHGLRTQTQFGDTLVLLLGDWHVERVVCIDRLVSPTVVPGKARAGGLARKCAGVGVRACSRLHAHRLQIGQLQVVVDVLVVFAALLPRNHRVLPRRRLLNRIIRLIQRLFDGVQAFEVIGVAIVGGGRLHSGLLATVPGDGGFDELLIMRHFDSTAHHLVVVLHLYQLVFGFDRPRAIQQSYLVGVAQARPFTRIAHLLAGHRRPCSDSLRLVHEAIMVEVAATAIVLLPCRNIDRPVHQRAVTRVSGIEDRNLRRLHIAVLDID